MCYLLLTDIMHSMHYGVMTHYTTNEIYIKMPASSYHFHDVYSSLLAHASPLPEDMTSQEDGVLIIVALLSDIVLIRTSFSLLTQTSSSSPDARRVVNTVRDQRRPAVPLSPPAELPRMLAKVSRALDRWFQRFSETVSREVLSLFFFCRLYLACPEMRLLPRLAGYRPALPAEHGTARAVLDEILISDDAMRCAWLILDNINVKPTATESACLIWLPIVLFYAALVVWRRLKSGFQLDESYGTLKILGMFQKELERLPWPCCAEMIKTLENLMHSTR